MSKNELYVLRANLLGGMDAYVREVIDDEDWLMAWLELGVPDGANEAELMEIAEDEADFNRICRVFADIINW
jgi:hypothetical protein